jgi:hypothetical protein
MVGGRDRKIRPPDTTIGNAQTFKRLRRSYFVNKV